MITTYNQDNTQARSARSLRSLAPFAGRKKLSFLQPRGQGAYSAPSFSLSRPLVPRTARQTSLRVSYIYIMLSYYGLHKSNSCSAHNSHYVK
jgi:hypothetical protein